MSFCWIPKSLDSQNWSQEALSVSLCLCHFLLDPWILGSCKSRILKYAAQNQLCLFAGSLDPWILKFSKLEQRGSVCKFFSVSFFVGSLDPWIPLSLDSQNWSQEALSVRLCLCHFLLDPWILGSHKSRILKYGAQNLLSLFAGSLDP